MILELNHGEIKVKQNSCENKAGALIYLEFKDTVITNFNTVKIFIEGQELIQVKPNMWKIDFSLLTYRESRIEVVVEGPIMKTYRTILIIEEYISFGRLDTDKFPQAFIDQNNKMKAMEERIKKLEIQKTII